MAIFEAFLDGVTGAGLFGKLDWPGAPSELIDSRTREEFDAKQAARDVCAERFSHMHLKPSQGASCSERRLRKE